MTSVEFTHWQAYFELHPFGSEWDDMRMATLSAKLCATLTGKDQLIKDHLATYGEHDEKQTPEQVANMARNIHAMLKARG